MNIDEIIKIATNNDIDRLTRIKGIGVKTAKAIIKAFTDPETLEMILDLRKSGLDFGEPTVGIVEWDDFHDLLKRIESGEVDISYTL